MLLLREDGRRAGVEKARQERLLAERGEERLDDPSHLEDPDEGDVELRHAVEEEADPFGRLETEARESGRDGVREEAQVAERVRPLAPVRAFPEERGFSREAEPADPVGQVPADVERIAAAPPHLLSLIHISEPTRLGMIS